MAETLYRKYRPQSFADVVGQRHIRVTLEHALQTDRVAHAYMFTGPRGVGKTTTARILARAVNCEKRGQNIEPCNACPSCLAILHNQTLDLIEIDAASQTGVDNVRDNIIQGARMAPVILKQKIFIIDEVHMLSLAAFNALLKILEEPPAHVMFILATTEIHRVPETIISRTQRFDFQRVGFDDTVQRIISVARQEKRSLGRGVAERIARASGGSLRDAESILGQVLAFPDTDVTIELLNMIMPRSDQTTVLNMIEAILPGRAAEAIQYFHQFVADGGDVTTCVQDVLTMTRHLLLLVTDPDGMLSAMKSLDPTTLERLRHMASNADQERCLRIIDTFTEAVRQVAYATIEELPVEVAIVRASGIDQSGSVPATLTGGVEQAAPTRTIPRPATPKKADATPSEQTQPIKAATKRTAAVTLEQFQQAWRALQQSSSLPPGLALSVKQASVTAMNGELIELTVPFALHADRLNSAKNLELIRQYIAPEYADYTFRALVDSSLAPADLPPREEPTMSATSTAKPVTTTPALVVSPVAVTTGDELWDNLVASLDS